ncbi:MAG TPA: EAL domain-containing protein, partial [Burkholderiaceae bacterium]|nr:EAL domain-containing protein [Burkholderiaceae bacterium]
PSPLLPRFTLETFHRVLGQLARLPAAPEEAHVAVNISARILEHPDFVSQLLAVMRLHDVRPGQLTLELTETALIANPVQAKRVIDALAAEGIELSIDDFGAGFTSFGYLREFAIKEIKIDKSYILTLGQNQFDMSLVTSLVVFCRSLDIRLVAEGVETTDCWQRLLTLGCHCGQGYGISRPMPFDDLPAWLDGWRQRH